MAKWQRYSTQWVRNNVYSGQYPITNGSISNNWLYDYVGSFANYVKAIKATGTSTLPYFSDGAYYPNTSTQSYVSIIHENYDGWVDTDASQTVAVANIYINNGSESYYIFHPLTDVVALIKIYEFVETTIGSSYVVKINSGEIVDYYTQGKGSYIDIITASDGQYPDNGISGSYWYVLIPEEYDKAFVNAGDTIYKSIPYTNIGGIIYKLTPYTNISGTIYELVTSVEYKLNAANFEKFFTTSGGSTASTDWTYSVNESDGIVLNPNNAKGTNSYHNTTSTISFVAQNDLSNVKITGAYYTESGYDKITITNGNTSVLYEASGQNSNYSSASFSMSKGTILTFKYSKDVSSDGANEALTKFYITCDPIIG